MNCSLRNKPENKERATTAGEELSIKISVQLELSAVIKELGDQRFQRATTAGEELSIKISVQLKLSAVKP